MTFLIGAAVAFVALMILIGFAVLGVAVYRMAKNPRSKVASVVDAQLNGDINIIDGLSPIELAYIAKLLTRQRSAEKAQSLREEMARSAQLQATE